MGNIAARFYKSQPVKVMMFGLDDAGKTTIMYQMKLGELVTTIPTIGFNVESITIGESELLVWDMGLRSKARAMLKHYVRGCSGAILVVDRSDHQRMCEAKDDLLALFLDNDDPHVQVQGIPILILANKSDQDNTMTHDDILRELDIAEVQKKHPRYTWNIMSCCAVSGEGLEEGFSWLASAIANNMAYDDVSHHVTNAKHVLLADHSDKVARGWDYWLCGVEKLKTWWRGT